jgi:phosphoglycolate phosphatase-like HAD superfamily hydrolase
MIDRARNWIAAVLACALLLGACATPQPAVVEDPLPSWREGPAREAVLEFVARVTAPGSSEFVPAAERVAVFDNDGTLWSEKPTYFQLLFAIDRARAMVAEDPSLATRQPFEGVVKDAAGYLQAGGEEALVELVIATHTGMSNAAFRAIVSDWIASARHPVSGRPYTDMVYQPMLELLTYLRSHGFKTFIVSGGGITFMRPWVERVYGIPPEQVVGSSPETRFVANGDQVMIERLPEFHFVNDKAGKPLGIERYIGRRPILAVGNSDGDFEMLQWTTAGSGPRLGVLIHHTDAQREWAYDRDSMEGRLDKALDQAPAAGWIVVDMARDWSTVFPEG